MCRNYQCTSSVTNMLKNLGWESLQQQSPDAVPYPERSCRYSSNNLSTASGSSYQRSRNDACRCATAPACMDRLSFRVRSGCGILCPLRSANCCLTVSRPSCPASHLCNSSSGFYPASLHRFYVVFVFLFYLSLSS